MKSGAVDLAAVAKLMGWDAIIESPQDGTMLYGIVDRYTLTPMDSWQLIGAIMERLWVLGYRAELGRGGVAAYFPNTGGGCNYFHGEPLDAALKCAAAVQAQRDEP